MTQANYRYLGVACGVSSLLTVAIALDVGFHGRLTKFDAWIEPGFIPATPTIWTHIAARLDTISDPKLAAVLAIAAAFAAMHYFRDDLAVGRVLLSIAGVALLIYVFKSLIARPTVWHLAGTSFPSGHTAIAVVLGWTVGRLAAHLSGSTLLWAPATAAVWAAIVGWSRVIINAHWVSDVLGGAALGVAVVTAVEVLLSRGGPESARP